MDISMSGTAKDTRAASGGAGGADHSKSDQFLTAGRSTKQPRALRSALYCIITIMPPNPPQQVRPIVAVRVRPPEDLNTLNGGRPVRATTAWHVKDNQLSTSCVTRGVTVRRHEQAYSADFVFSGSEPQNADIYKALVQPVVESTFKHCYHGIVFAYGQTSSGKTHTMHGDLIEPTGMIDYAIQDLLSRAPASLRLSCCQIHLDNVTNLLVDNPAEATAPGPALGPSPILNRLRNIRAAQPKDKYTITSYQQAAALLKQARQQRTVNATKLNQSSSRSHVVVQLDIEPVVGGGVASLMLVDLAGSEDPRKAGAEAKVLQEAISINLSLLNLQNVITAWATNPHGHIPHEDSTLTRKLKPCLNPDSRVAMLITIRCEELFQAESIRALEFAKTAMRIVSKPISNKGDLKRRTEQQLRQQLEALGAECEALRRERAVQLRRDVEEVGCVKRHSQQELLNLRREQEALKTELQGMMEQTQKLSAELRLNQQQSAGLQVQLRAKQARLQELEQLLAVSKCRSEQLEAQFSASQSKELELVGQVGGLQAKVAGLQEFVKSVTRDLEGSQVENKDLAAQLQSKKSKVDALELEVLSLNEQLLATQGLNVQLSKEQQVVAGPPRICVDATTQSSPVKQEEQPAVPASPDVVIRLEARLVDMGDVVQKQQDMLDASDRARITLLAEQQAVTQWLDTLEQQLGMAGLQALAAPGAGQVEEQVAREAGEVEQAAGDEGGSSCVSRVKALTSAVQALWVGKEAQAASSAAAQQSAMECLVAEVEARRQEAAAVQQELAQARADVDAAQVETTNVRVQAEAAQQEAAAQATAVQQELEQARAQAEAAQQEAAAQAAAVQQELEQARAQAEAAQQEAAAQAAAVQQELEQARAQAEAAQQEAAAQATAVQQELEQARAQAEAAQQEAAAQAAGLQQELEQARAQAEAAQQEAKAMQDRSEVFERQYNQAAASLSEAHQSNQALQNQLRALLHLKECLESQLCVFKDLADDQSEARLVVRQELQSMQALASEAHELFRQVQAVCLAPEQTRDDGLVVASTQPADSSLSKVVAHLERLDVLDRYSPDVQHAGDQYSSKSQGPTPKAWDAPASSNKAVF